MGDRMEIIGVQRADGGVNAEGKRFSLLVTLPQLGESVPPFYERLYETVRELCERRGCCLRAELVIPWREAGACSFYLDFLWYRGRELLSCYRLSDNRDAGGERLAPPRALRQSIPKNGGWFRCGEGYVTYENAFTPTLGLRRSDYHVCLPEQVHRLSDASDGRARYKEGSEEEPRRRE